METKCTSTVLIGKDKQKREKLVEIEVNLLGYISL